MTRLDLNTMSAPRVPLRILLMSPYGGGKTYLIGYLSKRLKEITGKPLKLFDFDLGWQTLKSHNFDVDVTSYLIDPNRMGVAFEEFDEDFHTYLADPAGYGGFGIDSLTTLQGCAMDFVMKENKVSRRSFGKFQLTNENDFGALVTMLMQILPQILMISSHSVFVMTAHTRVVEDKISGETKMRPAISGKALPSQIGAWFTECWFLKTEGYRDDVQRLAQTMSDSLVDCKTQMAGVPFELDSIAAIELALISYGLNREPTKETLALLENAKVSV